MLLADNLKKRQQELEARDTKIDDSTAKMQSADLEEKAKLESEIKAW